MINKAGENVDLMSFIQFWAKCLTDGNNEIIEQIIDLSETDIPQVSLESPKTQNEMNPTNFITN